MSEPEPENVPKSSATPEESRQPESTTQATPQLNEERNGARPEPEPVPSTSGTSSKGKKLASPKSRFCRRKRENWEESIISAFKFIKISGEWNEDDSSDYDEEEEKEKEEQEQEQEQEQTHHFDYEEHENLISKLSINTRDTYPEVYDVEDEAKLSTSISSPLEAGIPENELQPVSEQNLTEENSYAHAPAPASPPPQLLGVSPLNGRVMSNVPFCNFNLPEEMISNLRDTLGITVATFLQEKAIPILMQENDAFLHAAPGSGKTVAFTIPAIQHLSLIRPPVCCKDGIRVLVVVPNKETAMKTYQIFTALVRCAPWISVGQFGGGEHFRTERDAMRKGVIILITTPARFLDHVRRTSSLFLKNLSCLIVDGLDQIFEQGDEKHLSDIITVVEKGAEYLHHPEYVNIHRRKHVEAARQTVLTSSSITENVARFTALNSTNPVTIDDREGSPPQRISISVMWRDAQMKRPRPLTNQYFMMVPERMKLVALVGFVLWKIRVANERRILVFTGTQTIADYFSDLFLLAYGKTDLNSEEEENPKEFTGINVFKITPFMSQADKVSLFMTFTRSNSGILFCSDSVVTDIDLPRVDWIVHLHAPTCTAGYMARLGLANPGFQIGASLILLLPAEKDYVQLLRGHEVPLMSMRLKQPFRHLSAFYPPTVTVDDMIFEIQNNMEDLVHRSPWMRDRACMAFASWCRMYSSYPEKLKHIFRISSVHTDNYLHSFGLRGQARYALKHAKKLHSEARRNQAKKRSAPSEAAGSAQESSKPPPPPSDLADAQMPTQAGAPTQTPAGTEQMMYTDMEELEDQSECKKRKTDEKMEESDDEEGYPEKRSK